MKSSNRLLLLITVSNLILIWCIALLNSVIGPWGLFLYLPGLFLLPHYQLLDPYRVLSSLILTGLFIDLFFNHFLGVHAVLLGLIFHLSKEFFHLGKQSSKQIILFQGIANFLMAFLWFLLCEFENLYSATWSVGRFLSDIIISTFVLIPISFWHTHFCNQLIQRFEPSFFHIFTHSK